MTAAAASSDTPPVLSRLVELSKGDMLFVAAGDDVSLPQRCERVMQAWIERDREVDLVASALLALAAQLCATPAQPAR